MSISNNIYYMQVYTCIYMYVSKCGTTNRLECAIWAPIDAHIYSYIDKLYFSVALALFKLNDSLERKT